MPATDCASTSNRSYATAGTTALGMLAPGPLDRRVARVVMITTGVVFLASVGFARVPLPAVVAFVPAYESALSINDLVTAALLVGQFMITPTRRLRALICGYAFTGLMATVHMLSFPGLFAPGGLIGGDAQTTAWLYMFWHGGFAVCVLAYAVREGRTRGSLSLALGRGLAAVVIALVVLTALATGRVVPLPAIMDGNRYTPVMIFVVGAVWLASAAAFVAVRRRSTRTVLDLWLSVVMAAWLGDIALSAVFNAGRFDLGFYLGRILGLLAASFVLVVLLVENGWLHARLLEAAGELRRMMSADPLTGIANRRTFDDVLQDEWRRAQRHGSSLSLLMIDVDHFKAFNDTYGHVVGDDCLRGVADALRRHALRAGEIAARIGGEEFAVLLPGAEAASAASDAAAICEAVSGLRIAHAGSRAAPHVTVSIGVATILPRATETASEASALRSFLEAADAALYAAKLAGRNRVSVAASSIATPSRSEMAADPVPTVRLRVT